MSLSLLVVIVLTAVAYKVTTASERARLAKYLYALLVRCVESAEEWFDTQKPFFDMLRARTPFAPVTPAIVVINTAMFLLVLISGFLHDRNVLVEWGANLGPRTTNGEWWRLVTSLFVHAGPLHLLACLIGFLPIAFVLERLVGSVALAVVYVTSGVFAGLMTLAAYPMDVSAGASGAICGLYGLAVSTLVWGLVQPPRVKVPLPVLKWLAITGAVFLSYNLPSGIVAFPAEVIGFVMGLLYGVAIGRGVSAQLVPMRRSLAVGAAVFALVIAVCVPLRGIRDFRPVVDGMMATDERTAATFRTAANQMANGRLNEKSLIGLIEREIIPALENEQHSLASPGLVPDDQKALVTAADDYLKVRIDSWRVRATAFRKGSLAMLREADKREGAARDLLVRIPRAQSST